MITPNQVNTTEFFWESAFGNFQKEVIARNITMLLQTVAEAKGDEQWPAFSAEEYEGFRAATSEEPVSYAEMSILHGFVRSGHLETDEKGSFTVTNEFLDVVAQFAVPEVSQEA